MFFNVGIFVLAACVCFMFSDVGLFVLAASVCFMFSDVGLFVLVYLYVYCETVAFDACMRSILYLGLGLWLLCSGLFQI